MNILFRFKLIQMNDSTDLMNGNNEMIEMNGNNGMNGNNEMIEMIEMNGNNEMIEMNGNGLNPQNNVGRSHPPINFNQNAAAQQKIFDTLAQNSLNALNAQYAAQQARQTTTTTTTIHHGLPVALVGVRRVPIAIGPPTWNGIPVDTSGRGVYTYNGFPVASGLRIGRAINGWVYY